MNSSDHDPFADDSFKELDSPTSHEVKDLIAELQNSHNLRYKMMNLESWALATTMDEFLPGFWSKFLHNRRVAMQQFIEKKRAAKEQELADLQALENELVNEEELLNPPSPFDEDSPE